MDDCFIKGNNYFFNDNCYEIQCPDDKIALSSKDETIKNYFHTHLLLDDNLISKICICDINNGVWINITSNDQIFQNCLSF